MGLYERTWPRHMVVGYFRLPFHSKIEWSLAISDVRSGLIGRLELNAEMSPVFEYEFNTIGKRTIMYRGHSDNRLAKYTSTIRNHNHRRVLNDWWRTCIFPTKPHLNLLEWK